MHELFADTGLTRVHKVADWQEYTICLMNRGQGIHTDKLCDPTGA